jgi:hypothetical protein
MSAGKYKIICEQGATFALQLQWKDSSDAPINVLGYTAALQVRTDKTSEVVVVELSTSSNGIQLLPEGVIKLSLPASTTTNIEPRNYVYDLELTSPTGMVTRLLEGQFLVEGEVTK